MEPQEFIQDLGSSQLLTIEESARLLRVSPATIWRLVKHGHLPAVRVGKKAMRIRKTDLASVIQPATKKKSADKEPAILASTKALQAAQRIWRRREEIGTIDVSVTELINEGLDQL